MSRQHWGLILRRGFGTFGQVMVDPATVLPVLIVSLGGDAMIIGVMGSLMALSGVWQLVSAWYLEGTPHRRRPLLRFSFAAALPFLGMAAAAFAWSQSRPTLALVAILALVFLRNVAGALGNPVDLDVCRLLVREADRSRVFSIRGLVADSMGLAAGGVTYLVLDRFDFPGGFFIVALLAFAAGLGAWGAVHLLDETRVKARKRLPPGRFVRESIAMLRPGAADPAARPFRRYVLLRHLVVVSRVAFPFLTIYAVERFAVDLKTIGLFVIALRLGSVTMGILLSALGRRLTSGARILQLGLACTVLGLGLAVWASTWYGVLAAFFLQGCFGACQLAADPMLMMQCAPPDRAARAMTLTMVACHPAALVLPLVAGAVMSGAGFSALAIAAAVAAVAGALALSSSWLGFGRTLGAAQGALSAGD